MQEKKEKLKPGWWVRRDPSEAPAQLTSASELGLPPPGTGGLALNLGVGEAEWKLLSQSQKSRKAETSSKSIAKVVIAHSEETPSQWDAWGLHSHREEEEQLGIRLQNRPRSRAPETSEANAKTSLSREISLLQDLCKVQLVNC